jgi:hypothetical protein
MISRRLKGKWSLRRRQGFHSTLSVSFTLRSHSTLNWYNLHSYYSYQGGDRKEIGLTMSPFLAIHAKGRESISPKQKDCTTTSSKFLIDIFQNWYVFQLVRIFQIGI